jgi:hypothetical protein
MDRAGVGRFRPAAAEEIVAPPHVEVPFYRIAFPQRRLGRVGRSVKRAQPDVERFVVPQIVKLRRSIGRVAMEILDRRAQCLLVSRLVESPVDRRRRNRTRDAGAKKGFSRLRCDARKGRGQRQIPEHQ